MSILRARGDASCPAGNGTTYTSTQGSQYELYCDFDFDGEDLPSTNAKSYTDCISSCDTYAMDESEAEGANCIGAVFGAADPNGNQCWLKYAITDVKSGGYMIYAARRIQYQVGDSPVYSDFAESSATPVESAANSPSPTPLLPSSSTEVVSTTADVESSRGASASNPPSAGTTTLLSIQTKLGSLVTSWPISAPSQLPSNTVQSDDMSSAVADTLTVSGTVSVASVSATTIILTASSDRTVAPSAFASTSSTQASGSAINNSNDDASPSGLSMGAKIGIGVGAGVLLTLLLSLLVFFLGLRRRRRNKLATANYVAGSVPAMKGLPTDSSRQRMPVFRSLQELQGDEPPVQELDGARSTNSGMKSGVSGSWK